MTWDRLRTLGYVLALVLLGMVIFSLYGAFRTELEKSHFIGFLGGVVLGAIMVSLIMVILIVPERRRTAWVEAITTVNAKYLFLALIVGWALAMGLLASLTSRSTPSASRRSSGSSPASSSSWASSGPSSASRTSATSGIGRAASRRDRNGAAVSAPSRPAARCDLR